MIQRKKGVKQFLPLAAQNGVLLHREIQHQGLPLSVFWNMGYRWPTMSVGNILPIKSYRASGRPKQSREDFNELRLPVSFNSCNSEDLSAVNREGDLLQGRPAHRVRDLLGLDAERLLLCDVVAEDLILAENLRQEIAALPFVPGVEVAGITSYTGVGYRARGSMGNRASLFLCLCLVISYRIFPENFVEEHFRVAIRETDVYRNPGFGVDATLVRRGTADDHHQLPGRHRLCTIH